MVLYEYIHVLMYIIMYVHVHITYLYICKQLPSNQSFDKQISSHQKGGGVSRWGKWVGKSTTYKFDTCTLIGVHSTMHLVDPIKVHVSYTYMYSMYMPLFDAPSHTHTPHTHRTYSRARRVLEQYQHMPSFHGIQRDCSAIVDKLIITLKQRMDNEKASTATVVETVDLLLELNQPASDLCQQFLAK